MWLIEVKEKASVFEEQARMSDEHEDGFWREDTM